MRAVKERLFKPLNRAEIGREIEDELRLHLELLTEEHLQLDLPLAEARAAALKRFGDVERIKDQCVEISRRRHPLILVLKSFLILVFLAGVLLRVFVAEYHVKHCADIMMAVGILGRLLLYARGLSPASFLSKSETGSPLMLIDKSQTLIAAYDPSKRTPVERIIFDK
ncbi:MAG TPA: permease prefix domain 1-containing protein [Pyrinomonadaceae bacterium]|nr:permease prefix domain 1-containing protein [Pyrinomonadaceae bacterium]